MDNYIDAEYESIRDVMKRRGTDGGKLPGKTVRYIPEARADQVIALDEMLQTVRAAAPYVIAGAAALLSFLAGTLV